MKIAWKVKLRVRLHQKAFCMPDAGKKKLHPKFRREDDPDSDQTRDRKESQEQLDALEV